MKSLGLRIISDLKADPRKTTAMVVLAVVLVVAWTWALSRDGKNASKKHDPADRVSDSSTAAGDENGTVDPFASLGLIPLILTEALPFEEIGKNPFKSSLSPLMSPGGN